MTTVHTFRLDPENLHSHNALITQNQEVLAGIDDLLKIVEATHQRIVDIISLLIEIEDAQDTQEEITNDIEWLINGNIDIIKQWIDFVIDDNNSVKTGYQTLKDVMRTVSEMIEPLTNDTDQSNASQPNTTPADTLTDCLEIIKANQKTISQISDCYERLKDTHDQIINLYTRFAETQEDGDDDEIGADDFDHERFTILNNTTSNIDRVLSNCQSVNLFYSGLLSAINTHIKSSVSV